jgi:hypothetical protein
MSSFNYSLQNIPKTYPDSNNTNNINNTNSLLKLKDEPLVPKIEPSSDSSIPRNFIYLRGSENPQHSSEANSTDLNEEDLNYINIAASRFTDSPDEKQVIQDLSLRIINDETKLIQLAENPVFKKMFDINLNTFTLGTLTNAPVPSTKGPFTSTKGPFPSTKGPVSTDAPTFSTDDAGTLSTDAPTFSTDDGKIIFSTKAPVPSSFDDEYGYRNTLPPGLKNIISKLPSMLPTLQPILPESNNSNNNSNILNVLMYTLIGVVALWTIRRCIRRAHDSVIPNEPRASVIPNEPRASVISVGNNHCNKNRIITLQLKNYYNLDGKEIKSLSEIIEDIHGFEYSYVKSI